MKWQCGRFEIDLKRPILMGILNVTPDSFSDGGCFHQVDEAIAQACRLKEEGASIIDVGGESTRPNAQPVAHDLELNRVLPVLEALKDMSIPVSLDTRHTLVMQKAIQANLVDMINDVSALEDEGSLLLLKRSPTIGIALMHKQGVPSSMQLNPHYENVVVEVTQYLKTKVEACQKAGIDHNRLVVDPGFGFGKTMQHNQALLKNLRHLQEATNTPILVGLSRKSMLGSITGEKIPAERLGASIAIALEAVRQGASIIRVHDVKPTLQALQVYFACR